MGHVKFYTKSTRSFAELSDLLDCTKNHFTKLTLEALVTTGFEDVARDECIHKLGKKCQASSSIGRIFFNLNFDDYKKCKLLKCVNRVNIVAGLVKVEFGDKNGNKEDDMTKIKKTVNAFDWGKVLSVWRDAVNFRGNMYPTRKEYEEAIMLKQNGQDKRNDDSDEVVFQSKNLYYEKTDLEKALDSVLGSDSDSDENSETECSESKKIVKYRVTCSRVGQNHSFTSQEAATAFGGHLQDKFNWIVDLSNYDLEIQLDISNNNMYVSVELLKSLDSLNNVKHLGSLSLRSTVCTNLLWLCKIKPGDVVIDPMCGSGSILIEGCVNYPNAYFSGGDEYVKAVERTRSNIVALDKSERIDVCQWDATHMPLRDYSVDVVVSDFPFGKKCGSKSNNKSLYKHALNEIARVLRLGSGRCVILTADKRSFDLALYQTKLFFVLEKMLNVNIGGLSAWCAVLSRTVKEYELKLSCKERRLLAQKEWRKKHGL